MTTSTSTHILRPALQDIDNLFVKQTLFEEFNSNTICSPLNYIGGKFKLLPQILPLFPSKINHFVDLFCGGCNVGVNVEANHYLFNDNLVYLIDLYKCFLHFSIEQILHHIFDRIDRFKLSLTNKEGYLSLRQLYNSERNPLDLFVLVAFSFNHQIRFNNNHQFNNPFGKERSSFNDRMKNNLISFVARLHSIQPAFSSLNFQDLDLSFLGEDDFVYADPPYLITTGTYNDGKRGFTGWNEQQEVMLLNLLSELDKRGVRFAISNVLSHKGNHNSTLHDWACFNHYNIHYLNKSYKNSNYQTTASALPTEEVLIVNY